MKHIKRINEIFGLGNLIRSKIYDDEDVAREILKKLDSERIKVEAVDNNWTVPRKYGFTIDGFSITTEVHYFVKSGRRTYVTEVDGKPVNASQYTMKKIFGKSAEIFNRPEEDEYDPIHDFRKAFRTR